MQRILKMTMLMAMTAIGFSSCDTDEPETYWYSYGTYLDDESAPKDFVVALDNGSLLNPIEASGVHSDVKDSSRVVVTYSIESEKNDTTHATVVEVARILTKGIIQLTENNKDSIGSDAVQLSDDNIWLTENHLNFVFGYYGGSVTHYINLTKPIGVQKDENGRQILEFRHNENNDSYNYWILSVVSFDMRSLYETGMDSINFVVHANNFNDGIYKWEGTYHFNNDNGIQTPKIGEPRLNDLVK
jgi:hypothetical protein